MRYLGIARFCAVRGEQGAALERELTAAIDDAGAGGDSARPEFASG